MAMNRFFERYMATLILCGIGAVFLLAGLIIGIFGSRGAAAEADRAAAMRPLTPSQVERLVIGDTVMVEGVLSERNTLRFRNFVAYISERYYGTDDEGKSSWRVDERVTPPLLIEVDEVGSATVQIGNNNYRIEQPHERWQDQPQLVATASGDGNTMRYEGLVVGPLITTIGTVQRGSEGPELQAEFIYGGTLAAYIAEKRGEAAWFPWFGAIFGGIGLLLLGIGTFITVRQK
jgi:hypothetical protein